jgi:fucose permease
VITPAQLLSFRVAEAKAVEFPYLGITLILLAVAVLITFSKLPEVRVTQSDAAVELGIEGLGQSRQHVVAYE